MNTKSLGSIISQRRKLLQVSQTDLAEISEISLRSLKAIELGKGNPAILQLTKVLNALGLQLNIGAKRDE